MGEAVAVIVATRGRPEVAAALVGRLRAQSRPPDRVLLMASEPADLRGVPLGGPVDAAYGRAGLTAQRNAGLDRAEGFAHLVFFDDDFVPSRFWVERALDLFAARPDLCALTGAVLADGAKTAGVPPAEAGAMVDARDEAGGPEAPTVREGETPYGCNMAFRAEKIRGERFDERLVLYGWQEDADFGARAARRGACLWTDALWGVHLGTKAGRVPGRRLGYSQVVNPVYLTRKGSLRPGYSARLMARNVAANAVRSLSPEPFIDRRGRLVGNLLAMRDVMLGRVTPERAAEL